MRGTGLWLGLFGLVAGACGGGSSSPPQERLLLVQTLGDDGGTILPGIASYTAALGVESSPGSGSYPEVFEDKVLTPASEGTTIPFFEEDDIEFPQLVALLTNGVDDILRVRLTRDTGTGVVGSFPESHYQLAVAERFGPDLQGYTITRFELHVVDLRFDSPGSDPSSDGNWQDRLVEVRIEVYGIR